MLIALDLDIKKNLPTHHHAVHELIISKSDRGTYISHQEETPLAKGQLILVPGNQAHEIRIHEDPAHVMMICFDDEYIAKHIPIALRPTLMTMFRGSSMSCCDAFIEHNLALGEAIVHTLRSTSPLRQINAGIKLSELLLNHAEHSQGQIKPHHASHNIDLHQTIQWIENNLDARISIADMADRAQLSKTAFTQHFRKTTGMSLVEYTNKLRLEKSLLLLSDNDQSITDIAFQCGFNNLGYFYKSFNQQFRMTPNQYRKTLLMQGGYQYSGAVWR